MYSSLSWYYALRLSLLVELVEDLLLVPPEYDVPFDLEPLVPFSLGLAVPLGNHLVVLRAEDILLLELFLVDFEVLLEEDFLAAPDLLQLMLLAQFLFLPRQLLLVEFGFVLLHQQPLLHLLDAPVVLYHFRLGLARVGHRVRGYRVIHHII